MSYGTPRAAIADNDVICLRCAVKVYAHLPEETIDSEDISKCLRKFNHKILVDRQGEKIQVLLEGQNDDYLHAEYCPLCTSKLCAPGCECYEIAASVCPFCVKEIDSEDIKAGRHDRFHEFHCHSACFHLGIQIQKTDEIYCSFHTHGKSALHSTLTLETSGIEKMVCAECGRFLLDESLKVEFFGDDDGCDCEMCEKVFLYAQRHASAIRIDGYRLGLREYTPEDHGFKAMYEYAQFLGYNGEQETIQFSVGYIDACQEQ